MKFSSIIDMNQNSLRRTFTLIELLIVIVIIGILAIAMIPRLKGIQGKARDRARIADIYNLQAAMQAYALNNKGVYPQTTGAACIGAEQGVKCRPGYQQNQPGNGGDGSTGARAFGNSTINDIIQEYLGMVPIDPSPGRSIGGNYVYRSKGSIDYHCSAPTQQTLRNKAVIARQPETIGPTTDEACAPGKRACCSALACGGVRFCVYQLEQ